MTQFSKMRLHFAWLDMKMSHSDRELLLVCLAKGLRTFGFGSVSVILALFLARHNFSSLEVGAIFSATLIEDAIFTTVVSLFANQLGMRKVLLWSSVLMVASGLCLCLATQPWLIALAAVCGIFSPAGFEGGPFAAVEQAIIARDVASDRLTNAFSWYNLTGFAGAALGSLLAGICFGKFQAFDHEAAYQIIFLLYIASGIAMASLYAMLPKNLLQHKASTSKPAESAKVDFRAVLSKKNAGMLVLLQGLDAFGGGFVVQSLIAYWFYMRYHVSADFTGVIFCMANILAAGSFLAAPFIANKIGLLKNHGIHASALQRSTVFRTIHANCTTRGRPTSQSQLLLFDGHTGQTSIHNATCASGRPPRGCRIDHGEPSHRSRLISNAIWLGDDECAVGRPLCGRRSLQNNLRCLPIRHLQEDPSGKRISKRVGRHFQSKRIQKSRRC